MRKYVVFVSLFLCLFAAVSAFAQQNKVVVVPLSTNKVPAGALPVAYGLVDMTSLLPGSYGVASVAYPSVGVYEITLNKSFVGYPVVVATAFNSTPNDEIATWSSASSGANIIEINLSDGTGAPVYSAVSFVVFGVTE